MSNKYSPTDRKILADLNAAQAVDFGKVTTVLNNNGGITAYDGWDLFCGVMQQFIRLFWIARDFQDLHENLSRFVQIDRDLRGTGINTNIG